MTHSVDPKTPLRLGILAGLMVAGVIVIMSSTRGASDQQRQAVERRGTAVTMCERLGGGIHASLVALQYQIIYESGPRGGDFHLSERALGWERIDESLASLNLMSEQWTAPNDLNRMEKLRSQIEALRAAQDEIERIVQTPENIPARQLLLDEVVPLADQIDEHLASITEEETRRSDNPTTTQQPADVQQRGLMLANLAILRHTVARGLTSLHAGLASDTRVHRTEFQRRWQTVEPATVQIVANLESFTTTQLSSWEAFKSKSERFAELAADVFKVRAERGWNKAELLLSTSAMPKARAITAVLAEIIASQQAAAIGERERVSEARSLLALTSVLSGFVLILAGAVAYSAIEAGMTLSRRRHKAALAAPAAETEPTAVAVRGTVKFFNATKGFGFIEPADGSDDVFIHQNDIPGMTVHEGEAVEFDVVQWEKGPRAANVKMIDGA